MSCETRSSSSASSMKKKIPLRRPRGKRGGAKNRRKPTLNVHNSSNNKQQQQHALHIAQFHTLEKKIAQARTDEERRGYVAEQEALGGLQAYQDASLVGAEKQRGGETGKWCAQMLREVDLQDGGGGGGGGERRTIRLLDVGSLSGTAYAKYKWIKATSIDLNPRSENVLRSDFFDFDVPTKDEERYDVVALSLVVNFVGDLQERGRMLLHAHNYLKHDVAAYMFLVLPLACVENSRYLTHDHLRALLEACGWHVVRQDDSARLTRWLCRETSKEWNGQVFRKQELRKGASLNNFCIVVR